MGAYASSKLVESKALG